MTTTKYKPTKIVAMLLAFLTVFSLFAAFPKTVDAAILTCRVCGEDGFRDYKYNPSAPGLPYKFASHGRYVNLYWISQNSYRDTPVYCVEMGNDETSAGYDYTSSTTPFSNLSTTQRRMLAVALAYAYDGNCKFGGDWYEEQIASQIVIWMISTGYSNFDSYGNAILNGFAPNSTIGSIARTMLEMVHAYATVPSFATDSSAYGVPEYELKWDNELNCYKTVLTDTNGVLSAFNFSARGLNVVRSGNKLTVTTTEDITSAKTYSMYSAKAVTVSKCQVFYLYRNSNQVMAYKGATINDPVAASFNLVVKNGRVEIVKTSEDGKNLEGVEFTLSNETNTYTAYSDKNGNVVFPEVAMGTYTVHETLVTGYLQPLDQEIVVHGGEIVSLNFYNPRVKGRIAINKTLDYPEAEDGTKITPEGIVFEITDKETSEVVGTMTTNEDGYAVSELLYYGDYTVTEVKGLDNYEQAKTFDVEVREHLKTYTYSVENKVVKRYLQIVKTDSETGEVIHLAGTSFKVKDSEGNFITQTDVYQNPVMLDTFVTDESGKVSLPEKLLYGEYSIVEIKAPYGYILNEEELTFSVTKECDSTIVLHFADSPAKGKIEIFKTGMIHSDTETEETEYGTLYTPIFKEGYLPGAVFEIRAKEDIYTPDGTLRYLKDELVNTVMTNEDGLATSKELYLGTYVVTETQAPDGYLISESPFEVTIEYENQTTPVVVESLSAENQRQTFSLSLKKECEVFDNSDVSNPTFQVADGAGFTFGLYTSEAISDIPEDSLVGIYTTDKDGKIADTGLMLYGNYYFKELKTKDGYVLNDTKYPVSLIFDEAEGTIKEVKTNGDEAILNEMIKAEVVISKTGASDAPLAGCEITIRNEKNDIVYVGLTDKNGLITVTLPQGKYTFTETKTVETYSRNVTSFSFEVTENGEVIGTTSITNELTKLIVKKVNQSNEPLNGVIFTLYKDGEEYATYTTSLNGEFVIEGLPFGEYSLKETKTIEGYRLNNKTYDFVVDETYINLTEPVIFTNHRIEVPKTGDSNAIFIFGILAFLSAGGIYVAIKKKKKVEEK